MIHWHSVVGLMQDGAVQSWLWGQTVGWYRDFCKMKTLEEASESTVKGSFGTLHDTRECCRDAWLYLFPHPDPSSRGNSQGSFHCSLPKPDRMSGIERLQSRREVT